MCICVELDKAAECSEKIVVYNDGKCVAYNSDKKEYKIILDGWRTMINGAHDMPAFGVSLNGETVKALKSGVWVEFVFSEKYEFAGMPFEKLLINVKTDYYGFNIIRFNKESGYDGRCFYYDLVGKNMNDFYYILVNL